MSAVRRTPYVTLLLAGAAWCIHAAPWASELLQYERGAVAAGDTWRAVTCHLTHVSGAHLLWDLLAFVLLGGLVETWNRRRFVACLAVASVAVTAAVVAWAPAIDTYRGLSGIDSALFVLLAGHVLGGAVAMRDRVGIVACSALGAGFLAKVGWEVATGTTVFVDSAAAGMVPVPVAHAAGALVGLVLCLLRATESRPGTWRGRGWHPWACGGCRRTGSRG